VCFSSIVYCLFLYSFSLTYPRSMNDSIIVMRKTAFSQHLKSCSLIKYMCVKFVLPSCAALCHSGLTCGNLAFLKSPKLRNVSSPYFVTFSHCFYSSSDFNSDNDAVGLMRFVSPSICFIVIALLQIIFHCIYYHGCSLIYQI
jgi:hypothetical protein